MVKLSKVALLLSALVLGTSEPAHSLDFSVGETRTNVRFISAKGSIQVGDAARLRSIIAETSRETVVVFNSIGGSVTEAMEIGRDLRRNGVGAMVPDRSRCLSACILAFLGGTPRVVSPQGQLGSHQFYWPEGEAPDGDRATQLSQRLSSSVLRHFLAMGIDPEALTLIMDTPPNDMLVFSPELLDRFKLVGTSAVPSQAPVLPQGSKRQGCPFPESFVNSDPLALYPECKR